MCVSGKELRAAILEVLFVKELRTDDCGQNEAKRGDGLDVRNLKGLSFWDVYFTSKYTHFWKSVNRHFLSVNVRLPRSSVLVGPQIFRA